ERALERREEQIDDPLPGLARLVETAEVSVDQPSREECAAEERRRGRAIGELDALGSQLVCRLPVACPALDLGQPDQTALLTCHVTLGERALGAPLVPPERLGEPVVEEPRSRNVDPPSELPLAIVLQGLEDEHVTGIALALVPEHVAVRAEQLCSQVAFDRVAIALLLEDCARCGGVAVVEEMV